MGRTKFWLPITRTAPCHARIFRRRAAPAIVSVRTASFQLKTTSRCGSCHSARAATYQDTFHGQVTALGFVVTARCWNCHHAHEILPASDPESSIAPANLQKTCGQCHENVSKGFVSYDPHANPR